MESTQAPVRGDKKSAPVQAPAILPEEPNGAVEPNEALAAQKRRDLLKPFQLVIRARKGLIACGDGFSVALHENGRLLYAGSNRRGQSSVTACDGVISVSAVGDSVVVLCEDSVVCPVGRSQDEIEFAAGLAAVRRVEAGPAHIAVLTGSGRVLLGGAIHPGSDALAEWTNIIDIACGADFTAGLSSDGSVRMAGGFWRMHDRVLRWSQMVGIFADAKKNVLYGITKDGALRATRRLPKSVRSWRNLIQISAAGDRLCAVTKTGQLLSTFPLPACMTEGKSFVAVAVGDHHAIALTREGSLVSAGDNRYGQCETEAMGQLFSAYDEFIVRRRDRDRKPQKHEYDLRLRGAEAERFGRHLVSSERISACITAYGRVLASPGFTESKRWQNVHRLASGNAHLLGLGTNGRVFADGNAIGAGSCNCCDVTEWTNVRDIVAGSYHSLGVTYDGHVYFCGSNEHGQGDVTEWRDIRLLRTTDAYTVGLTYDGRILVAGLPPFDLLLLERINGRVVDILATETHVLCLLSDGRAFATLPPDPYTGATAVDPTVARWQNIRAISAGRGLSVGLCYGGTVRASGGDAKLRNDLADWRNIVAIGCGVGYVAGLESDGHIRIAGTPAVTRECRAVAADARMPSPAPIHVAFADASRWQDIIAMSCGPTHLIALNRDGQVMACGSDSDGQCSVTTHFVLFRDARSLAGYGQYRAKTEEMSIEQIPKTEASPEFSV